MYNPIVPAAPGIYRIKCVPLHRVYVGSSKNLQQRYRGHLSCLRRGCHTNKDLQAAWNEFGAAAFNFSILETLWTPKRLVEREQFWIDFYRAAEGGFNVAPFAGSSRGLKHSAEWVQKVADANRGKKYHISPEAAAERTHRLRTRCIPPEECKARGERLMAARLADPEGYSRKLSAGRKGKAINPESRKKQTASMLARGDHRTEAEKQNISEKLTGRKKSPETIERMKAAQFKRRHPTDTQSSPATTSGGCLQPEP
jgi:group I intron endonuclease